MTGCVDPRILDLGPTALRPGKGLPLPLDRRPGGGVSPEPVCTVTDKLIKINPEFTGLSHLVFHFTIMHVSRTVNSFVALQHIFRPKSMEWTRFCKVVSTRLFAFYILSHELILVRYGWPRGASLQWRVFSPRKYSSATGSCLFNENWKWATFIVIMLLSAVLYNFSERDCLTFYGTIFSRLLTLQVGYTCTVLYRNDFVHFVDKVCAGVQRTVRAYLKALNDN
jgi:hypothetical protein